jgi:glycosyltransferase involved in cell wall biosynthesis
MTPISPKISVVTVCYNIVKDIEATIQSVLNQTYRNIEYIIIDGGSTDGTVDVIRKYADKITYWVSEPDKGIYDAMNKAINIATGEYINFMNAGDTFADNNTLENVFDGYSGGSDVIYGDVIEYFHGRGKILKRADGLKGDSQALGLCHQSTFIKLSVHKRFPYDLSYKICADRNAFLKIFQSGGKFEYVAKPISIFEQINGVSTTQKFKARRENIRLYNKKWYNSKWWWISLVKISVKKLMILCIGEKRYNDIIFKSISKKYIQIS